jgi:APA family basic amino acid/polyamine antiporter
MGREAFLVSAVVIAGGLFVYWFYGRIRTEREYALLHLVERITARELTSGTLETELKDIIRERDDITKDRFDHIIEACAVLDIEQEMSMEQFFEKVSETMAGRLDLAPKVVFDLLMAREKESSTVLGPGLAIPHIVMEGARHFDILCARCREGVRFSETAPHIHAIFVLIGTKDERNFHLRALSAIAQIVQDSHFEKSWMAARGEEALRDIVLLGKRRR